MTSSCDRAVSITVNYVIALGITAVLISGLLVGAGGYVENQREQVVREELDVVAEQLAAGIADADRLSESQARSRSVRVGVDLPERVAGESYRIYVRGVSDPADQPARHELTLRPSRSDVSATLTVSTTVGIEDGSVTGGWTVVRLDTSGPDPTLVVADGDASSSLSLTGPTEGALEG
ncbi:DUF7266 family protein [Halobellus inordinatus]|uniref:DUF7266 family protein n=1 Tax=Halobellus inordinatus TaxID=1126236 RepID=UPI0021098C27|nr:hypothetical protein [Halobellus inordinatus]